MGAKSRIPAGLVLIVGLVALWALSGFYFAALTFDDAGVDFWFYLGAALLSIWLAIGLFRFNALARKVFIWITAVHTLLLGIGFGLGIPWAVLSDDFTLDFFETVGGVLALALNVWMLWYLAESDVVALFAREQDTAA